MSTSTSTAVVPRDHFGREDGSEPLRSEELIECARMPGCDVPGAHHMHGIPHKIFSRADSSTDTQLDQKIREKKIPVTMNHQKYCR